MRTFSLFGRPARNKVVRTNLLDNVYVASPCPANWEKMIGDDRVRHCQECNLNVYNLSEMTRIEAERLIANREGRMCVRFYRRADGTILTQDCPRGLQAALDRMSRLAGAALSAMMSVGAAFAQISSQSSPQNRNDWNAKYSSQLSLRVVNSKGGAISGALIHVVSEDGKKFAAITDAAGLASLSGLPPGAFAIRITHWRFMTYRKQVAVTENKMETLSVALKSRGATLPTGGVVMVNHDADYDGDPGPPPTTVPGYVPRLPLR